MVSALLALQPSDVHAVGPKVQRAVLRGLDLSARKAQVKQMRQRWRSGQLMSLQEAQTAAQPLIQMGVNHADFQKHISAAPLEVRHAVFQHLAQEVGGSESAERAIRGYMPHLQKTVKTKKRFFTLTTENFSLFQKVMGRNVVWFTLNNNPNHLFTMLMDQNTSDKGYSNTYGKDNSRIAKVGSFLQVALPLVLTDKQMDRFVDYMNTGVKHGKEKAFGFFTTRDGQEVKIPASKIACTNWATAAPIGSLAGWIKDLDHQIKDLANSGQLNDVPRTLGKKGLHGLLAAVSQGERGLKSHANIKGLRVRVRNLRNTIIQQVLANEQVISGQLRENVQQLGRLFDKERRDFYKRSPDTVGRKPLAHLAEALRSQNPDKWGGDLMLSKLVPLVAVLAKPATEEIGSVMINLRYAGTVGNDGKFQHNRDAHFNGAKGVLVETLPGGELKPGADAD